MKKFINLLILMLFISLTIAQTKWDGVTITPVTAVKNVYTITNGAELAWVAQQCKDTISDFSNSSISISDNIDLDNHEWTPIGTSYNPFKGTVKGNWKVISNLKISIILDMESDNVGLFGYVVGNELNQPHISNLFLENVDVAGIKSVGAMVGYANYYIFDSCYVNKGTVTGSIAVGGFGGHLRYTACTDSYTKVDVTASEKYGGGFVGINDSSNNRLAITYCYARGAVRGTKVEDTTLYIGINGGFVGLNNGKVKSAYMISNPITGEITGNFCGINSKSGIFDNCYFCNTIYPSMPGIGLDSAVPPIDERDMVPQGVGQMTSQGFVGSGSSGLNGSGINFHWSMDFTKQPTINDRYPIHLWQFLYLYDSTAHIESLPGSSLSIYPNPVRNTLYIEIENIPVEKVEIVDLLGKPIISRKSNYEAVDMSQFNNGIYFVKIYTEKNIITRKFIKQ